MGEWVSVCVCVCACMCARMCACDNQHLSSPFSSFPLALLTFFAPMYWQVTGVH